MKHALTIAALLLAGSLGAHAGPAENKSTALAYYAALYSGAD